jgi:membrane fusion protein (multidrug efflux system)
VATSGNPASADQDPTSGNPSRKKWILIGIGVLFLIAGAVWLVHWWTVGRFIESTNDAYLRADSVSIAPKVSGYVTEVYVGDNQHVDAGAPLVKLDTRQYQASLDQAQASIDAKQADIVRAEADVQQQQANIEQAKAQARASGISATHAAQEFARFQPLAATGAETAEKLADLRSTRDQAKATYDANVAAVKSAEAQIATMNAAIVQAKAQLEASAASARGSKLDLDDTVVKSALDGRVGDRTVRVGQYVQPGTRLMTVVPLQDVYLVANFKETQVGDMRIGQPATLHVDALPGLDLHGKVDSFSPGTGSEFALLPPENATGNFTKIVQRVPVRIHIDADAKTRERLLPGLSVTVDVDTQHAGTQTGANTAGNADNGATSAPAAQNGGTHG